MRIIVVSDSHGLRRELREVREKYPLADAYLHLGDSELSPSELDGWQSVKGNNDYYSYPNELVVTVGDIRIYMAHSHLFDYSNRILKLAKQAKLNECDLALFGHSHVFYHEVHEGVVCVNPGSLRYNRDRTSPSYAIIDIDSHKKIEVHRINLE
ncbi:MAG: metallophosphoesterase [Erysipelothrix sp.]|nr:metallophosphoesterase [Erysipelothrix sp.]